MISAADVVVQSGDLVDAPLGEEIAMMDVERGKYYVLDAVGADVWTRLREPVAVTTLVVDLQARYDVDAERCEADVLALLHRLHDQGLIRTVG